MATILSRVTTWEQERGVARVRFLIFWRMSFSTGTAKGWGFDASGDHDVSTGVLTKVSCHRVERQWGVGDGGVSSTGAR